MHHSTCRLFDWRVVGHVFFADRGELEIFVHVSGGWIMQNVSPDTLLTLITECIDHLEGQKTSRLDISPAFSPRLHSAEDWFSTIPKETQWMTWD